MRDSRLYVVVRNDLPCKAARKGYMAAQGGHAIAEYLIEHQPHMKGEWQNNFLILLQANYQEFENLQRRLNSLDIKHSKFREPDLGNKLTAMAILNNRSLFKRLKPL